MKKAFVFKQWAKKPDGMPEIPNTYYHNPRINIHDDLVDALNPDTKAGPVTCLKDMSPEKQAEMHKLYDGGPKPKVIGVMPSIVEPKQVVIELFSWAKRAKP